MGKGEDGFNPPSSSSSFSQDVGVELFALEGREGALKSNSTSLPFFQKWGWRRRRRRKKGASGFLEKKFFFLQRASFPLR